MEEIIGFVVLILAVAGIIVAVYELVDTVKDEIKTEMAFNNIDKQKQIIKMQAEINDLKYQVKKLKENA